MIWIYVWEPSGPNIGHAAAEVSNEDGGYVSWWPAAAEKPLKTTSGGTSANYDQDCDLEGRPADWTATVKGLNEKNGLKWWLNFFPDGKYNASSKNCAWAVATFLKKSGADERIPWWRKQEAHPNGKSLGERFLNGTMYGPMYNSVRDLVDFARVIGGDSGGTASFADRNMPTWTPADIKRYVKLIND